MPLYKSPEECQSVWDCKHPEALTAPILSSTQENSFLIIFVSLLYKFIPSQQPIHTAWLSWTYARTLLIHSQQNTNGKRNRINNEKVKYLILTLLICLCSCLQECKGGSRVAYSPVGRPFTKSFNFFWSRLHYLRWQDSLKRGSFNCSPS